MLKSLRIRNFKCFSDHTVYFEPTTVLVGQNNAGKTTIAEALRIISIVTARNRHLVYRDPPEWLSIARRFVGCAPSLYGQQIRFDTIFNRYGDPPARLTAQFADSASVDAYIGPEGQVHAVLIDAKGIVVRNKSAATNLGLPLVSIMPQVAPLAIIEKRLDPDYVRSSANSYLSPLHFRNQLYLAQKEEWSEFCTAVEETWSGLSIRDLELVGPTGEKEIQLQVRDRDFVAEIGAMGHGLQMWMQTMWFLARSRNSHTVILDEPDVYMHADLQRRLIRYLRHRFPQIIITTHSTEIMAEVEPGAIVVVDKQRPNSKAVSSLLAVQDIINRVGSVHNIHLTKVWNARRFLIVEGQDIKILKLLYDALYPNALSSLDTLPNMSIPGWGAWHYVVGSSMFLKNAAGEEMEVICILDSDYHTPEQIEHRRSEALAAGVTLHIWEQKEIENYLIVPSTILRIINKNSGRRISSPSIEEIQRQIEVFAVNLEEQVFDGFAQEFISQDRSGGVPRANGKTRVLIKQRKMSSRGLCGMVSGKSLLSSLSQWSQSEFGVMLNPGALAREILAAEIDQEIREALFWI